MNDYVLKLQKDLRKKLDCLCWMHNEPALHVTEHFAELRRQVDLDAERLLSGIQTMKCDTENAPKDSDVNEKRLEFIRILEELEKRTGTQPKPQTTSSDVYASFEQRVEAFKDSSSSLDILEDLYVRLAREIIAEYEWLERRIFGEQTVIYLPSGNQDRLGSILYFGDIFLRREDIKFVMKVASRFGRSKAVNVSSENSSSSSEAAAQRESRFLQSFSDSLLIQEREPEKLCKSQQITESLFLNESLKKFGVVSKFFYIGKSEEEYSGYSAEGTRIEREFLSYQCDQETSVLRVQGGIKLSKSANLFDVCSSTNCKLEIESVRLDELHAFLLPTPVTRLTKVCLNGVHFESFREKHLFKDLFSLKSLFFQKNKLEKLDLNCFNNLRQCQYLFLSSNMINELSGEVEPELLSNLASLGLNDNQLTAVNKKSIPKSVSYLNLSKNKLKRLDEDFFAELTQLSSVNLAKNQLTMTITEATFVSCRNSLRDLNLSQNASISVTEGAFRQMTCLSGIDYDLSGSFADMPLLTTLRLRDLTSERLQALLNSRKPQICLEKLETCCISDCSIKSLERNPPTEKKPEINRFSLSWIVEASQLKQLDFSRNLIETLDDPKLFADFKSINEINLSGNRLTRIHRDIFQSLTWVHRIDLSSNKLSSIDMGLFRHQKDLRGFKLSSNGISFLNIARLLRICPSLRSLNLADNQLDDRSTAEPIDSRSSHKLEELVLANNRLDKMDFVRDMTSLKHLNLQGNRIESVMSNSGENLLGRLSKLTHLNLSRNKIRSLRDEMFAHLRGQLEHLDISGNLLDF